VLVELLAGKVLFGGTTPAIMKKHLLEAPALPVKLPEGAPPGVLQALQRALGKQAQGRYPSMAEFVAGLHGSGLKPAAAIPNPQSPFFNQQSSISNPQLENPAGIEWVEIPAGEFLYGENKEKQYIRKAYLIGKYPVTNAQYQRFLEANPGHPAPQDWDGQKRAYPSGKQKHPVVYVSWNDAQAFCAWAG
jgi:formylglycine-generating enzyme required for sulfatase activity